MHLKDTLQLMSECFRRAITSSPMISWTSIQRRYDCAKSHHRLERTIPREVVERKEKLGTPTLRMKEIQLMERWIMRKMIV